MKVSKGWSFSSVIRTNFLSYSCFFLLLVEVELLLEGEGVGVGDSSNKKGREDEDKDEERRSLFSLFTYVSLVGATSL